MYWECKGAVNLSVEAPIIFCWTGRHLVPWLHCGWNGNRQTPIHWSTYLPQLLLIYKQYVDCTEIAVVNVWYNCPLDSWVALKQPCSRSASTRCIPKSLRKCRTLQKIFSCSESSVPSAHARCFAVLSTNANHCSELSSIYFFVFAPDVLSQMRTSELLLGCCWITHSWQSK